MIEGWSFNPPPHWPKPPGSWTPPSGWLPDPAWGPLPPGWQLWVPARPTQRRPVVLPLLGLAAVLGGVVLAVVVPRAPGPGADDPRAGGTVIGSPPRPALIAPLTTTAPTFAEDDDLAEDGNLSGDGGPTSAPTVRPFGSCADLREVYPNGVGMPEAVDRTEKTPVTDFGRSTSLYRVNDELDQDEDQIACEPH
jgi:hypothetical protein